MANLAANETRAVIEELQEMAFDPTMDQCCRRDVQQQINQERIRHALQQQDRVDARQRMAAATIRRDAPPDASGSSSVDSRGPEQQQPHAQHEHHSKQQQEQQGASEGDDAELQRLREQRLRQLRAESAVKQEQRQEGFGRLNTVQESNLLKLCIHDPPGRGLLVVHLAVQGYEPCNTLDECLEEAAAHYRGTYFVRCVVSRGTPLVAQLQLPHGIPALLVVKHGAVLGKAHINQFGGADIWSEEVMSYLQRFKVLHTGTSSSSNNRAVAAAAAVDAAGSSDGGSSDGDVDEADGGWQTPCEVCGRTYPHEHIRSIYSSRQHDSSDEDDG